MTINLWWKPALSQGFDARLANRPFLVFDFLALWRSGLSARVPESQKLKTTSNPLVTVPVLEPWAKRVKPTVEHGLVHNDDLRRCYALYNCMHYERQL